MKDRIKKEILEWVKALLYAIVAATIIRLYVFETMLVPTGSMIPTINIGDRLFIEKVTYTVREPDLGDVVVIWSPFVDERALTMLRLFDKFMDLFAPRRFKGHVKYVKRLVGKEGDVLKIKDGKLYINGVVPQELKDFRYEADGIFKYEHFYEWLAKASELRNNKKAYRSFLYDLARKHGRNLAVMILFLVGEEDLEYGEAFLPGILNYFDASLVLFDEKKGKYYIPGMKYHEFFNKYYSNLKLSDYIKRDKDGLITIKIPKGFYFFMGDNSKESLDSRFFGFVPKDHVIGSPILRIWPLNNFGPVQKK